MSRETTDTTFHEILKTRLSSMLRKFVKNHIELKLCSLHSSYLNPEISEKLFFINVCFQDFTYTTEKMFTIKLILR